MKSTKLVLCLMAVLLVLTGCNRAPEMKYEDGSYRIEGLGLYEPAPIRYEAVAILSEHAVGRMEGKPEDLIFYAIRGAVPEKMIASERHELFVAAGTRLPELWEMEPTEGHICQSAEVTYSLASLMGKELEDLIDRCQNGAHFPDKEIDPNLKYQKYEMKFASARYPGIYFCLTYRAYSEDVLIYQVIEDTEFFDVLYPGVPVETETYYYEQNGVQKTELYAVYNFGKYILCDRYTGKCFAIDDSVEKKLNDTVDTSQVTEDGMEA